MDNDLDSVINLLNDADIKSIIAQPKQTIILPALPQPTRILDEKKGNEVITVIPLPPGPATLSSGATLPAEIPADSQIKPKNTTDQLEDGGEDNEESKIEQFEHQCKEKQAEGTHKYLSGAPALWIRNIEKGKVKGKKRMSKPRYLVFRPYIDPINIRPYKAADLGYYYKIYKGDVALIRYTLEDNGFREAVSSNQEWSMMWSISNLKSQVYQSLRKYQKVNHFPRSIEITRKDCLCKNITKMQSIYGIRHFGFVPKTFVLPQELPLLTEEMEKDGSVFWIVKPAASSQGKGIFVTNNPNEIPPKTPMIASRYISNPLLLDGYKFDLRIYLAITSIEPLRLYVYEEGLARFATCKYTSTATDNKGNRFMHLTNYSVNKFNANFVANQDPSADGVGSKWSLTALRKYFASNGYNDAPIWAKIEDILIKTILSIEPIIKSSCDMYVPFQSNCFELLGFDILLDSNLQPWLLEVNLSPSLNCDAPLDQKIKGELIADLFTMAGVVPLDQRDYSDELKGKSRMQLNPYAPVLAESNGLLSKGLAKGLSKKASIICKPCSLAGVCRDERAIIKETEDEYKRKGRFKRVFPTVNYPAYKSFFEEERPSNILLYNYVLKKTVAAVPSEKAAKGQENFTPALNNRSASIKKENFRSKVTRKGVKQMINKTIPKK